MDNNYQEEMRKFLVPEVMFGNRTRELLTNPVQPKIKDIEDIYGKAF